MLGYSDPQISRPMTTRRPKRPVRQARQARAQSTVKALLEAGARILAEGGWPAFNTNAVAMRSGVSIGSLYEYFENKQALVDAIADGHLAQGEALLAEGAARLGTITQTGDDGRLVCAERLADELRSMLGLYLRHREFRADD